MSRFPSLSLFCLACAFISLSHASTVFSTYDLFKNSGFSSCPPKFTNSTDIGVSWSSRMGTVNEVHRGEKFCDTVGEYITIILPAEAHSSAFTPGWFSLALQILGWVLSFVGFWKGLPSEAKKEKGAEKKDEEGQHASGQANEGLHPHPPGSGQTEFELPKTFWVTLPYEIARQLAWWIQIIRAFTNLPEASWISPVMFVAPGLSTQYFVILADKAKYTTYSGFRAGLIFLSIGILFLMSFFGMFIATIVLFVKRLQHGVGAINYSVLSSVLADPSLLGSDLPPACLDRVSAWGTVVTDPQGSWWAWVQFGQFFLCLWVLNRLAQFFRNAERKITASVLQLSLALGASLLIPAAYQAISTPLNGKYFHSTLVNGGADHGVCNLIIVFLDKRLGYVDVAYQRAERIVLGLLGVQ